MKPPKSLPRLTHCGLLVEDMDIMQNFYNQVLSLVITDEGPYFYNHEPVNMAFLSNDPGEHHQIVFICGYPSNVQFTTNQQMSFLVEDLDELRAIRRRASLVGVRIFRIITHGNAWSIYFQDPEDNQIECYVHTPWYISQPHREPFDLDKPDEEIYKRTEAHCRAQAGFLPAAKREACMSKIISSILHS